VESLAPIPIVPTLHTIESPENRSVGMDHHSPTTPRRGTASKLLSKFLPGASIQHKMDAQKSQENSPTRSRNSLSSPESLGSHDADVYKTPPQNRMANLAKNDKEDEIEYSAVKPLRRLRERRQNMSLKAQENTETYTSRPRPKKLISNPVTDLIGADELSFSPVISQRVAIRHEIANKTAANRNRFFVDKKEFLLPLLPPNNYVKKLVEKHDLLTSEEVSKLPSITPYEEIGSQPRGVLASMKPYQLSGLSFMVYLHRNVCCFTFDKGSSANHLTRGYLGYWGTRWDWGKHYKPYH
jgi:hypothetical protein